MCFLHILSINVYTCGSHGLNGNVCRCDGELLFAHICDCCRGNCSVCNEGILSSAGFSERT